MDKLELLGALVGELTKQAFIASFKQQGDVDGDQYYKGTAIPNNSDQTLRLFQKELSNVKEDIEKLKQKKCDVKETLPSCTSVKDYETDLESQVGTVSNGEINSAKLDEIYERLNRIEDEHDKEQRRNHEKHIKLIDEIQSLDNKMSNSTRIMESRLDGIENRSSEQFKLLLTEIRLNRNPARMPDDQHGCVIDDANSVSDGINTDCHLSSVDGSVSGYQY